MDGNSNGVSEVLLESQIFDAVQFGFWLGFKYLLVPVVIFTLIHCAKKISISA